MRKMTLEKKLRRKQMNKITNQHGDLLFMAVSCVPDGAKELAITKGFVLERGEGVHTHVLEGIKGIKVYEHGDDIYVKVDIPVTINHEEHGVQTLMPGIKKKKIERVWDYESEEARKVID